MTTHSVSIIDLSTLSTPSSLAAALKHSLNTTGFFFVKNHGLEEEAAALFRLSEDFFVNETEEEKVKAAYKDNRGYTRVSQEVLDPTKSAPDLKEGFNTGFISNTTLPIWTQPLPPILAAHAAEIAAFQSKCFSLCQRLLEAFALALDLAPSFFTSQHAHSPTSSSLLRFLHYPAIPPGANVSPNRAGAHSDYGSLTLLFLRKEGAEGLQILPPSEPLDSDHWRDVPVVEGGLLVNIADALEFWSGAVFKSTLHRVVLPTPLPANGIPERYSMAWFNQPSPEAVFKCVVPTSDISANDLERMVRKGATPGVEITSHEHLQARLKATYQY